MVKTILLLAPIDDSRMIKSIEEANKLGYRIIVCCDSEVEEYPVGVEKVYVVSFSDKEKILAIAKKEKINGVIPLTDPTALSAAYVSQEMGIPGNTESSVDVLLSKDKFRRLQKKCSVFYPKNLLLSYDVTLPSELKDLSFPVVMKPILCSSSMGQNIIQEYDEDNIRASIQAAAGFSRNGKVCIEEYVVSDSLKIVEGDIFVYNQTIIWDGLRYCYRTEDHPLKPVYDVYPVDLKDEEVKELRDTVSRLIDASGATFGEFNFEGFFTQSGRFFVIEINPRQAGIYNPQQIELAYGVNLTKLLLTTAVGDASYFHELKTFVRYKKNILSYCMFSVHSGILDHIHIDGALKPKVVQFFMLMDTQKSKEVLSKSEARLPFANIVFEFESAEELETYRNQIEKLVYPVLQ